MKLTWLHMEFVLIFITGPSLAKLGTKAWQQLLTLASLGQDYFDGVICHASDWNRVYLPKSKWG